MYKYDSINSPPAFIKYQNRAVLVKKFKRYCVNREVENQKNINIGSLLYGGFGLDGKVKTTQSMKYKYVVHF